MSRRRSATSEKAGSAAVRGAELPLTPAVLPVIVVFCSLFAFAFFGRGALMLRLLFPTPAASFLKAAASMSSVQRVVASRALVRRAVNDTFTARDRTLRWGYLSTRMAYRITQDPYSITASLMLACFTNPKSATPRGLTELP